ncbi:Gfo/Idh/MocA family protein [Haloferax gibbonsii]|uniref:Dehydrogenase n=2 Tax=Haloferax gibbonsii TaxID=35746 RepID=A0A0K1IXU5_HALGI|nr:Gfo/Idh/MocA family oxidoreductase [Haloferax gibbonsii]AKU09150.1 dehydrogenase [Haloferax gibbonsii]ELZ85422.1 NADH-dependent dehydrogenase [Haloferax gibbonsii ATCC 33959]QOS13726.1 GFO family oxidoreductase [Haloferax gibbonsii]
MGTNIGYIGIDHHHRDPYFAVASELDATITAVCEPGRRVDVENIAAMDDRPDEITTEGQDMADLVGGAAVYEDPHELVSDADVDVAWITYRSDETPAIIESAVENGVHVVSEKPIARTAADLEDIAERANELGVTVSPTMYYRRNPVAMALRDRVSEGFFGDVWTLDGRFNASQLSYRDTDHYLYDRETSRGGALQWIGPHWVDVMPWILDDPIARVNARFHDAVEADVEAGAVLQFETESGTLGTYHTGYYLSDRGKDTHLGLYGTEGQALTPLHHDSLQHEPTVPLDITSEHPDWTAAPKRTVEFEFTYDRFPAWGDFVQDYFEDYFAGYETGDVPATVDDAVQLLRVLDAAYESGERGGWVEVEG